MFVKSGQDKRRRVRKRRGWEGSGVQDVGWLKRKKGWGEKKNNICLKTKNHNRGVKIPMKDERSKMEIPKKIVYMGGTGVKV